MTLPSREHERRIRSRRHGRRTTNATFGAAAVSPQIPSATTTTHAAADGAGSADATRDSAPAQKPSPVRDRYIDTLRALAIVQVVTFHLSGSPWPPYVYPAMGIMFALGGLLMAGSLERSRSGARAVISRRIRRIAVPYWAYGLAVVPLLLFLGWDVVDGYGVELTPVNFLAWVIPYAPPPTSAAGYNITIQLWFVSAYVWMMVLSALALKVFRRNHLLAITTPLLVPLLALIVDSAAGPNAQHALHSPVGSTVVLVGVYLPCWMLGYAHHYGLILRIPLRAACLLGVVVASMGLWVGFAFSAPGAGIPMLGGRMDMWGVGLSSALFSLGCVLILLRLHRDFSWMRRVRPLDALVASVNSRAMTIYLWGNVAIAVAHRLLGLFPPTAGLVVTGGGFGILLLSLAVWPVLFVIVLGVGWVEDVAARRRPRLLPPTHLG